MSTNTRPVRSVLFWSSVAIAWLETRSPGVALALTCTRIVIVAGALLRAVTVQVTLLPLTLQPLLALTTVSIGLIASCIVIVRGVELLLKTEIEKVNCWPIAALEVEETFSAVSGGSPAGVVGVSVGGPPGVLVAGGTGVLVAGGSGVLVGPPGVLVAGGTGVLVAPGPGVLVAGGTGVLVAPVPGVLVAGGTGDAGWLGVVVSVTRGWSSSAAGTSGGYSHW
jgi:hypothetical protein